MLIPVPMFVKFPVLLALSVLFVLPRLIISAMIYNTSKRACKKCQADLGTVSPPKARYAGRA